MRKAAVLMLAVCLFACSPRGPFALFQKLSPHDQYAERLKTGGLDKTGIDRLFKKPALA